MASDRDLLITGIDDTAMEALYGAIPGFDDDSPVDVIAGLRFLDERAGVHSDDDQVVMVLDTAALLLLQVEAADPAVAAFVRRIQSESDEDVPAESDLGAEVERVLGMLTSSFFEVSCTLPAVEYPENVRGRSLRVRAMTEDEASAADFFTSTVDRDGVAIRIPGPPPPVF